MYGKVHQNTNRKIRAINPPIFFLIQFPSKVYQIIHSPGQMAGQREKPKGVPIMFLEVGGIESRCTA